MKRGRQSAEASSLQVADIQAQRLKPPACLKKEEKAPLYQHRPAPEEGAVRRLGCRSRLIRRRAARLPRREVSNRSPTACERDEGCQPKKP